MLISFLSIDLNWFFLLLFLIFYSLTSFSHLKTKNPPLVDLKCERQRVRENKLYNHVNDKQACVCVYK